MRVRRRFAVLFSAIYLAGTFLVPTLHSAEPATDPGLAHPGCADCTHGALQAPCSRRGPCENPNHEHGTHPAAHAVPCPRCGGGFGATLVPAASAAPRTVADLARRLHVRHSIFVSLLLPHARTARAPPLSS